MLDGLIAEGKKRGLDMVIVELPWNREIIGDAFDEAIAAYQAPTKAIAEKYDVPYLDFNERARIPSEDFLDLSHLRPAGRAVWQSELARQLAAPVRRRHPADGAPVSAFGRGFRNRSPLVLSPRRSCSCRRCSGSSGCSRAAPGRRAARRRAAQPRGLVHLRLVDGRQGAAGRSRRDAGPCTCSAARARARPSSAATRSPPRSQGRRPARRRLRPRLASTRTSPRASPSSTTCRTPRPGCSSASTSGRFTATRDQNAQQAGPRVPARERAVQRVRVVDVGPREVPVHDPAGHLGVHHELDAEARRVLLEGDAAEHGVRAAPVLLSSTRRSGARRSGW